MSHSSAPKQPFAQPLDRLAIALMLVLAGLSALLIWSGDHSVPKVREFSWQEQQIGAEDTAFTLTFSRPMQQSSVEQQLRIVPPLPGKISWAGRRMAYTLNAPAPYGTGYQVQLQGVQDRFAASNHSRAVIQPFTGSFRTRDRAFVYIGSTGAEEGQLILYNLTRQQRQVLTPKELVVMDFKPYPKGDRILFSATQRPPLTPDKSASPPAAADQNLYTVTTGLSPSPETVAAPTGQVTLLLDSKEYQNLKFDLSADGQTIVIQRVSRRDSGEFGLWQLRPDTPPQPLKNQPGGDFLITPDSSALAIAQGQGLAILPLQANADPLDFLPKFGMVLSFARDGSQAAMVKFNTNYTRSLFLVTHQGTQKELLRTTGSILSAQFDPTNQTLYCLLTQLIPGPTYQEQPFLGAIDLKTAKLKPLLLLPNQRSVQMHVSPDGLALLFDQIALPSGQPQTASAPEQSSRLWLLPLGAASTEAQVLQPEELPLAGFQPRWLS